jgi:hypothetical protein
MATSGTVTGNVVAGSEYSYLNWQLVTQEVDNNRSLINWQSGWHFPSNTCRGLRNGDAGINGAFVWYNHNSGDAVHAFNSGHLSGGGHPSLQTASGSIWIGHNGDGTKSVSMSVTTTGWDGGPNLVSTGVSSFALPTIPRISNPPALPVIADIKQTSVVVVWSDGGGGAPVDEREVGYGTDPNTVITIITGANGYQPVTGLLPGTTYYFWARTHNSAGYSAWSPRAQAQTIAGARVLVGGVWKQAIPYVKVGGVWVLARPWVRVLGVWKESQ